MRHPFKISFYPFTLVSQFKVHVGLWIICLAQFVGLITTTPGYSAPVRLVEIQPNPGVYSLTPYLDILRMDHPETVAGLSFEQISAKNLTGNFVAFSSSTADPKTSVHWLRFTVQRSDSNVQELTLRLIFTDHLRLYYPDDQGNYRMKEAGELIPMGKREVPDGKGVFVKFQLPAGAHTCYLRMESQTDICRQFKGYALQGIKLYTAAGYIRDFTTPRIYHALFYGAILIMLLYNLFIYLTLRSRSYLYFLFFLLSLILFLAFTNRYIFELILPDYPLLDLYLGFLSVPVVSFSYVLFSRSFLQLPFYFPRLDRVIQVLLIFLAATFLFMGIGFWYWGRTIVIAVTIISLVFLLYVSIQSLHKGYTPARYFVAANVFFTLGGIVFAYQRFSMTQNLLVEYSLELSALMQISLFSMGLTDRISLMQRALSAKTAEAERLEKEAALEREQLIAEKNRELESKVRERTAEVLAQKEEIETQNEQLAHANEELVATQELIALQNRQLSDTNQHLELTVQTRTLELYISNEKLQQAIHELDSFIYRTAHDIRGPLARLLGLCGIAAIDVEDVNALNYFEKLNFEAHHLDYILIRLSTVYEINHSEVKYEAIDFHQLKADLDEKLRFVEGFSTIHYQVDIAAPIHCHSDYKLLLFIVRNLLENGIKFQNRKSPKESHVVLKVEVQDERLLIRVMNNGIGISPEDAPLIFNMFSRAASKHKSAGMGLYMVKRSVEKLQGTIFLVNNSNGFTEFRVELPLHTRTESVPQG